MGEEFNHEIDNYFTFTQDGKVYAHIVEYIEKIVIEKAVIKMDTKYSGHYIIKQARLE